MLIASIVWAEIFYHGEAMGTTFVTLSHVDDGDRGFWMSDSMLELWLRLLALHLPHPTDNDGKLVTRDIRDEWLLASHVHFNGCVPHGMEDACRTEEGRLVVRIAIRSLLAALRRVRTPLDADTINLLGIAGQWNGCIERESLEDIAHAFLDLLDGRITCTASSTDVMPGSKPYNRNASDV